MQPPKFHGLITIDGTNNAFAIMGSVTLIVRVINIPNGDYFIRGYGGEAIPAGRLGSQLVEDIQARVRAAGAEFAAFNCIVSDTGFVTMNNGESFTVTGAGPNLWNPVAGGGLARVLGMYNINTAVAATSFTGIDQHQMGWYPNVPIVDETGHPSAVSPYESDARVTVAPDGTGTTTRYAERQLRRFEIRNIADDYVFPIGTPLVLNRDYAQFWRDVLALGRRWRIYQDRTVQFGPTGTGAPETFYGEQTTAQRGTAAGVSREAADWARLWMVGIDARIYV